MKKLFIFVVILIVCMISCSWGLLRYKEYYEKANRLDVTLPSPEHSYVVRLTGKNANDVSIFTFPNEVLNREVTASISRGAADSIDNVALYSGDSYDRNFADLFPDHDWFRENVLRLGRLADEMNLPQDKLLVINTSKNVISRAFIKAGKSSIFLLFDLKPDSVLEVPIRSLKYWERNIGCEIKTRDNKMISFHEVGFSTSEEERFPLNYCVSIDEDSIFIYSEQLNGRDMMGTNIPAKKCEK